MHYVLVNQKAKPSLSQTRECFKKPLVAEREITVVDSVKVLTLRKAFIDKSRKSDIWLTGLEGLPRYSADPELYLE